MGFWGTFVVCHTRDSLETIAALAQFSEDLEECWRCADSWTIARYAGDRLTGASAELIADLVAQTQAPALLGFVMDSDAVIVEASSKEHGYWRSGLGRAALANFAAENGQDLSDWGLADDRTATQYGLAWAAVAGCKADEGALAQAWHQEGDPFIEPVFFRFLTSLGLQVEPRTGP